MPPKDDDINPNETAQIEYYARPRRGKCSRCRGSGGICPPDHQTALEVCDVCGGRGVVPLVREFNLTSVVRVGRFDSAKWVVTLNDVPYAGFDSRPDATLAARSWLGYVDGLGRIVDEKGPEHWGGCKGCVVRVVRR